MKPKKLNKLKNFWKKLMAKYNLSPTQANIFDMISFEEGSQYDDETIRLEKWKCTKKRSLQRSLQREKKSAFKRP